MGQQRLNQKKTTAPTHPHPTKTSVKSPVHHEDDLQGAIGNRQMGLLMETHPYIHPSSLNATMVGEMPMLGGMMPVSQGRIQRQPEFRGLSQEMRLENATLALPATGALVQRKLTLGTPGDMYEQEADRVARQVVDEIHSSPFREQNALSEEERKPAGGEAGRVQRQINVRSAGDAGGELSSEWEGELQRAKSGGQPLSPSVKEPMERAFGADFGGVRVHTGAQADRLARSIQAKAFTTGQDVFFRQGAYEPGSRGGQELIAHELTHVVQQKIEMETKKTNKKGEDNLIGKERERDAAPKSPQDYKDRETITRKTSRKLSEKPSIQARTKRGEIQCLKTYLNIGAGTNLLTPDEVDEFGGELFWNCKRYEIHNTDSGHAILSEILSDNTLITEARFHEICEEAYNLIQVRYIGHNVVGRDRANTLKDLFQDVRLEKILSVLTDEEQLEYKLAIYLIKNIAKERFAKYALDDAEHPRVQTNKYDMVIAMSPYGYTPYTINTAKLIKTGGYLVVMGNSSNKYVRPSGHTLFDTLMDKILSYKTLGSSSFLVDFIRNLPSNIEEETKEEIARVISKNSVTTHEQTTTIDALYIYRRNDFRV